MDVLHEFSDLRYLFTISTLENTKPLNIKQNYSSAYVLPNFVAERKFWNNLSVVNTAGCSKSTMA